MAGSRPAICRAGFALVGLDVPESTAKVQLKRANPTGATRRTGALVAELALVRDPIENQTYTVVRTLSGMELLRAVRPDGRTLEGEVASPVPSEWLHVWRDMFSWPNIQVYVTTAFPAMAAKGFFFPSSAREVEELVVETPKHFYRKLVDLEPDRQPAALKAVDYPFRNMAVRVLHAFDRQMDNLPHDIATSLRVLVESEIVAAAGSEDYEDASKKAGEPVFEAKHIDLVVAAIADKREELFSAYGLYVDGVVDRARTMFAVRNVLKPALDGAYEHAQFAASIAPQMKSPLAAAGLRTIFDKKQLPPDRLDEHGRIGELGVAQLHGGRSIGSETVGLDGYQSSYLMHTTANRHREQKAEQQTSASAVFDIGKAPLDPRLDLGFETIHDKCQQLMTFMEVTANTTNDDLRDLDTVDELYKNEVTPLLRKTYPVGVGTLVEDQSAEVLAAQEALDKRLLDQHIFALPLVDQYSRGVTVSCPRGVALDASGRLAAVSHSDTVTLFNVATGLPIWHTRRKLVEPHGMCFEANAAGILVADSGGHCIKRITLDGLSVEVVAGIESSTGARFTRMDSRHQRLVELSFEADGRYWVKAADDEHSPFYRVRWVVPPPEDLDASSHRVIKEVDPKVNGRVKLSDGSCFENPAGWQDGPASSALFYRPRSICQSEKTGILYVTDYGNHCVRCIAALHAEEDGGGGSDLRVTTLTGQHGRSGHVDGDPSEALFNLPTSVVLLNGRPCELQVGIGSQFSGTAEEKSSDSPGMIRGVVGLTTRKRSGRQQPGVAQHARYFPAETLIVADFWNHSLRCVDAQSGETFTLTESTNGPVALAANTSTGEVLVSANGEGCLYRVSAFDGVALRLVESHTASSQADLISRPAGLAAFTDGDRSYGVVADASNGGSLNFILTDPDIQPTKSSCIAAYLWALRDCDGDTGSEQRRLRLQKARDAVTDEMPSWSTPRDLAA